MFLKKNEMRDTENRNTVKCKTLKNPGNDWNKEKLENENKKKTKKYKIQK